MSDDNEDNRKTKAKNIEKFLASLGREGENLSDVILDRAVKPSSDRVQKFRAKICSFCRRSIAANDSCIESKAGVLICCDCKEERDDTLD